jgi:hypothetical protein
MRLFCLKTGWDEATPFLMEAALTVLPLDVLFSGDGNHNVGGPFHHFGYYFVFCSSGDASIYIYKILDIL